MKIKLSYAKRTIVIAATICTICFSSCKDLQRENAAKIVNEWTGKEIKFPEGITYTSLGKDSTYVDLYSDNYKILLYVDSIGCTSCRLKLFEWKKIINESNTTFSNPVDFIFFFQPKQKNERELQQIFKGNGFKHPVFIDSKNEINRLNKFPSKPEYQCFLLDNDNKVIIVGDPSTNKGIWALFKKVITERDK